MSFHAPPSRSKKEYQKKAIEEAIIAETSALRTAGLNFLPADQLRGKALVNLAIPSCFGGKVNWASIGPDFSVSVRARPTTSRPRGVTPYEGPRKFFKTRLPRPPEDQYENVPWRTPSAPAGGRRGPASKPAKPAPAAGASTKAHKTPSKTERRPPKRALLRVESDDEGPGVTPAETPEPPAPVQPVQPRAGRAVGHTDTNAETFEPDSSPEDLHQQRSRPVTLGILGTKQKHKTSKTARGAAAAKAEEMTRKLVERGDRSRRDACDVPPVQHTIGTERKQKPGRRDAASAHPAHQKQPPQPQPQSVPLAPPAPPAVEKVSVPVSDKLQSRPDVSTDQPQHTDPDLVVGSDETGGAPPGAPAAGWVDSAVDFTMIFREVPSPATVTQSGADRPVKRRSLSLKKKEKPSVEDTERSPSLAKRCAPEDTVSPILSQKRVVRLSSPALSSHPDYFSGTTFVHSSSPSPTRAHKAPQVKLGASQQTGSPLYRPLPLKLFGRKVGPASPLVQAKGPVDSDSSEANLPSHSQYRIIPASPVLSKRGDSQSSAPFSAPSSISDKSDSSDVIQPSQYVRPSRTAPTSSAQFSDNSDSSDVVQPTQYVEASCAAPEKKGAPSAQSSDESNSSDPIKPSQRVRPSRVAVQKQRSSSPLGRSPTVSSEGRKRREGSSSGGSRPSQLTPASGERERASRELFPCPEEDAEHSADSALSEEDTEADVTLECDLSSKTSAGMNVSKMSTGMTVSRMSTDGLSAEPTQRVSQTLSQHYDKSDSSDVMQPSQYVRPSRTAAEEKRAPSAQSSDKSDSSDVIQPSQYVRPGRTAPEEQRAPSAQSSDKSDSSDVVPPTQYVKSSCAAPEKKRAPSAQSSDESNSSDPIKPSQRVRTSRASVQKQRSLSPLGRSPTVSSEGRNKRREGSSSGGSRPSQLTPASGERERASRELFPCPEVDAEDSALSEKDTEADVTLECDLSSKTSAGMNVSKMSTGMTVSRMSTGMNVSGMSTGMTVSRMSTGTELSRISKNGLPAEPEHPVQHVSLREAAERALRATQGRQDCRGKQTSASRSRTPSSRRGSSNSTPRLRAAADAPSDSDSDETLRAREQARRARRAREPRRQVSTVSTSSERKLAVEPEVRREVRRKDGTGTKGSVSKCEVGVRNPPTPRHVVDVPPVMFAESASDPEAEGGRNSVTVDSLVVRSVEEPPCSIPTPFQAYNSTTDEEVRKDQRPFKSPPYRPALSTTTESSTNQPSSDAEAREGSTSCKRKLVEPEVSRREDRRKDGAKAKKSLSECVVGIQRPPTPRHVVDVPPVMFAESASDPEAEGVRNSVTVDSLVVRSVKEPPCSIPTPFQAYDSTTDEEARKDKRPFKSPPLYRPALALSTTTESSTKTSISTHNQPSSDAEAPSSEPNEGAPLTQPLPRRPKMSIGETIINGAGRRPNPKSPGPGPRTGPRLGPGPGAGPRPGPGPGPGAGPGAGPRPGPGSGPRPGPGSGLRPGPGSGPGPGPLPDRASGPSPGHGPGSHAAGLGRKRKGSTPSTGESNRSRTAAKEKCSVSVDRVRTHLVPLEEPGSESDPSLDLGSDIDMDDIEDTDEGSESPTPTPARPVPTTPGRAPPRSRHRPDRDDNVNRNLFHNFETPRRPLDQLMNPKRIRMSEGKSMAPTPEHSSRSSTSTSTGTSAAQPRAQQDQHHAASQESSLSSLASSRMNPMDKTLSSVVSVASSRMSIGVEVVWNNRKRAPAGGLPRAGKEKENTDPSIQAKRQDEDEYGDDRQKSDSPPNSLELISFYSPE